MQLPAYYLNHFIFNRIRAGGLAHTPIELSAVGGFGALLVVFNQSPETCSQNTRCRPREAGYNRR
jgi:hypothetical protein